VRKIIVGTTLLLAVTTVLLVVQLAANVANAQVPPPYGNHQSPIDIIDTPRHPVPIDPDAPGFGDTSQLQSEVEFTLKNTTGSPWCSPSPCTPQFYSTTFEQRWGSLKAFPPTSPPSSPVQILFGNQWYTLLEFHFHAPAEHLVNGKLTAMEVHVVFAKNGGSVCSSGGLLVIGQRIKMGRKNQELDKIFGPDVPLPTSYGAFPTVEITIGNVLSGLKDSYRYAGSLTSPANLGCSNPPGSPVDQLASGFIPENVSWVVLAQTIQMSEQQIARYQALFPNGDARGPQALKGRSVTKTKTVRDD